MRSKSCILVLSAILANLPTFANQPTIADAQAFMDRAESELITLNTEGTRAGWVEQTYLTGDTELLSAKADERMIARTTELVKESSRSCVRR